MATAEVAREVIVWTEMGTPQCVVIFRKPNKFAPVLPVANRSQNGAQIGNTER